MRYADLTGTRFGKLIAVCYAGRTVQGRAIWWCNCDCGGSKQVEATYLKSGKTQSCGCMGTEQRKLAASRQGHALSKAEKPKERRAWNGMLRRCYDIKHPSFIRYGARGITVCAQWRDSFAAFYADMGDAPEYGSLERIDNSKGYSPGNCRWATRKEQANNRRSNRLLTLDGVTLNVGQWAERLGWNKSTIANRLALGWPVERILTDPPKPRHST